MNNHWAFQYLFKNIWSCIIYIISQESQKYHGVHFESTMRVPIGRKFTMAINIKMKYMVVIITEHYFISYHYHNIVNGLNRDLYIIYTYNCPENKWILATTGKLTYKIHAGLWLNIYDNMTFLIIRNLAKSYSSMEMLYLTFLSLGSLHSYFSTSVPSTPMFVDRK